MHAAHGVGKHPRQRRHYKVRSWLVCDAGCPRSRGFRDLGRGRYTGPDAADAALSLELHSWPPDCPLAQSLSPMADRDLPRLQNDPDWIPGILGIFVDGASQPVALPEVDSGDGPLRPSW